MICISNENNISENNCKKYFFSPFTPVQTKMMRTLITHWLTMPMFPYIPGNGETETSYKFYYHIFLDFLHFIAKDVASFNFQKALFFESHVRQLELRTLSS